MKKIMNKIDDYTSKKKKIIKIDEDDNFEEYELMFVEKERICGEPAYFINTKTGENCGQHIYIYKRFYDKNGKYYPFGIIDEDCYELRLQ